MLMLICISLLQDLTCSGLLSAKPLDNSRRWPGGHGWRLDPLTTGM